jgi:hypothetical protein
MRTGAAFQVLLYMGSLPYRRMGQVQYAVLTSLLHVGAIVSSVLVFMTAMKLASFYTCSGGTCSFGVFTTHMQYSMQFVYIASYLSVFFNSICFALLIGRACSTRLKAVKRSRQTLYLSNVSYLFAVTLSALVCGALFSSDFIMLTKDEYPSGSDLKKTKRAGVALLVFQVLTHSAETF